VVTAVAATADAGRAAGRDARGLTPRSSHGHWEPLADRRDPVAVLEAEAEARVPELVPIRYARMAKSPFAFFRGAAGIMAADLAGTPSSGFRVQLCGDAHLANFGGFASPERSLLFDLNDFDETLPGPWEWDLKRLAASIAIALRERGMGGRRQREAVARAVAEYRGAMRSFARMGALDIWYSYLSERELTALLRDGTKAREASRFERGVSKARAKDSTRAFTRLACRVNGSARIVGDPPLIVPVEDLVPGAEADDLHEAMRALVESYAETLAHERRRLIDRFEYVHAARKVVGVGSVGTRAWVLLLLGREHGEPLFLQAKEAGQSALAAHTGTGDHENEGQRVVEGQRLMQAASDIFLGWVRAEGIDGRQRDFYVRQLWDWKASADLDRISMQALDIYARLCAWTLARAHARSGNAAAIAGYLGSGDRFDRATAVFAAEYARQNARDYEALVEAIRDGAVDAEADPSLVG
jgi:uncharacterized protein (DUF2252 family)